MKNKQLVIRQLLAITIDFYSIILIKANPSWLGDFEKESSYSGRICYR